MKRLFDVVAAALLLLALAPLFAAVSLAVLAGSGPPVLFRQRRIGRGFRPFTLYKFRTMNAGRNAGTEVTVAGNPRITPVGRWLRRTKLDELPQLVNVLRGEMSLVGPRPELDRYVGLYPEQYREILSVRPGLTDFASIAYRHEEELLRGFADPEAGYVQVVLPAKIELCRRYLRERGFLTDLRILCATVGCVLRG